MCNTHLKLQHSLGAFFGSQGYIFYSKSTSRTHFLNVESKQSWVAFAVHVWKWMHNPKQFQNEKSRYLPAAKNQNNYTPELIKSRAKDNPTGYDLCILVFMVLIFSPGTISISFFFKFCIDLSTVSNSLASAINWRPWNIMLDHVIKEQTRIRITFEDLSLFTYLRRYIIVSHCWMVC